jgi:hypothetical protein
MIGSYFLVPVASLADGVGTIGIWEVLEARIVNNGFKWLRQAVKNGTLITADSSKWVEKENDREQ